MAEKTLDISIKTTGDTSGSEAVAQSLGKVEPAARKAAAAADDVGKSGSDALDNIDQRTAGQSFANLADTIAAAGGRMKALAKDVESLDPELAKTIGTFGNLAEKGGEAASTIAIGFAAGGPIGAGLAGLTMAARSAAEEFIRFQAATTALENWETSTASAAGQRAADFAAKADALAAKVESESAARMSRDNAQAKVAEAQAAMKQSGDDSKALAEVAAAARKSANAVMNTGFGILTDSEKQMYQIRQQQYQQEMMQATVRNELPEVIEGIRQKYQAATDALAADQTARESTGAASLEQLKALAKQFDQVAAQAEERIAKLDAKSKPDSAAAMAGAGPGAVTTPAGPGYQGFAGKNPALSTVPANGAGGAGFAGAVPEATAADASDKSKQLDEKRQTLQQIRDILKDGKIDEKEKGEIPGLVEKLKNDYKSATGDMAAMVSALISATGDLANTMEGMKTDLDSVKQRVSAVSSNTNS